MRTLYYRRKQRAVETDARAARSADDSEGSVARVMFDCSDRPGPILAFGSCAVLIARESVRPPWPTTSNFMI